MGRRSGAVVRLAGAVHLFNNACITLTVGPICAETVPPALMATATGVVIACGELGGGGLAPIIAGQVADSSGSTIFLVAARRHGGRARHYVFPRRNTLERSIPWPIKSSSPAPLPGGIHTPTLSDALPYNPADIARQAIAAAEAGAAILHIHARDPETGAPTGNPDVYRQFLPIIKQAPTR